MADLFGHLRIAGTLRGVRGRMSISTEFGAAEGQRTKSIVKKHEGNKIVVQRFDVLRLIWVVRIWSVDIVPIQLGLQMGSVVIGLLFYL